MSVLNIKMEFSSPTEDIFPWITPETDPNRRDLGTKRRCDSDSGYMSVSPASGQKESARGCTLMTPDISSGAGYGTREKEPIYTPTMKISSECVKKRLLQCSQDGNSSSLLDTPEADSFSDLFDTSLYNEPIDISAIQPNPQLDTIVEENLDMCEISKKITVDLSMDSFCSEPITPKRSTPYCDRLFKTPASLSAKPSSPKKKKKKDKHFYKKKLPRPGALIGSEHIDFFAHLGVRANFMIIACKIFDLLPAEDIANIIKVSKTWKKVCLSYHKAKEKLLEHVKERKRGRENLPHYGCVGKAPGTSTPFRLKQPQSPPVSPSKFRFHLFQKEALRLKEDEKLTECPRCSLPSTVSPSERLGRCTRAGCGLEFCSSCRSPYHGAHPCTTSTPASPQRPQAPRRIVGSKESKRYLRRL